MTDARTHDEGVAEAGPGDPDAPGPDARPDAPPAGAGDDHPVRGILARLRERFDEFWFRPIDELIPTIVTFVIVAACVLLVLWVLDPLLVLSDTTPAGGDMGAHVWGPAFLRDHLLPKGRLSGWTMDWYAGFPAYQFYMIIPSLLIAVGSWFIPYGVAFKLVAVSGCVTFPVACWFLGRNLRLPFPGPALMAVGGLVFLFDRSFSIYGGNIASTMAGEFAFSMSLSIGIAYLGVLAGGFETGRRRAWAAALLALCGLCHLIPFLFVLVCTALYLIVRPGVGRVVYVATVVPVAGALAAFWMLPFVARSGYMNDMGWERITSERYVNYLFTRERLDPQLVNAPDLRWVIAFAAVGLLLSIVFRRRAGVFLAFVVVTFAAGFVLWPQGRFWNARLLPFYYLGLYLLAAVGVAELGRMLAAIVARDVHRPVRIVNWLAPAFATLAVVVMLLLSLRVLPGGEDNADGSYTWGVGPLAVTTRDRSFIDSWANWNFEGYEGLSTTSAGDQYLKSYPEYHDLMVTMDSLARERGCGRAMWEHEDANDRYGTPMALMLLPFWTDGCVGSMEGLYFEASATTPYHFLMQDEVSWAPSNAQRELPYSPGAPSTLDFERGVRHMQMMGVKYYMAINEHTQALAAASPALTRVDASGPWVVYEVADAPLVQGLTRQPAVLTDQPTTGRPWQDVAVCWWVDRADWDMPLTADGPPGWQRVARTHHPDASDTPVQQCQPSADWGWFDDTGGPTETPLPAVNVTNVHSGDDGVSFDVDRPGVPVLVKVSYFPNWSVTGAQGPYRATPNFMVVVPETNHVELHYGWTAVDLVAWALTLLGLGGLVWLARARPLRMAPPWSFWGRVERPDLYPRPAPPDPIDEWLPERRGTDEWPGTGDHAPVTGDDPDHAAFAADPDPPPAGPEPPETGPDAADPVDR